MFAQRGIDLLSGRDSLRTTFPLIAVAGWCKLRRHSDGRTLGAMSPASRAPPMDYRTSTVGFYLVLVAPPPPLR